MPACGLGLRCWPGAGTFLSSDGRNVSCAACPMISSALSPPCSPPSVPWVSSTASSPLPLSSTAAPPPISVTSSSSVVLCQACEPCTPSQPPCDCPVEAASSIGGVSIGSYGAAVAFLVIFLVLFLLACLSLTYTFYKLRSLGSASPIPLPQTMQRWWNRGGSANSIRQANSLGEDNSSTHSDLYQPLALTQLTKL